MHAERIRLCLHGASGPPQSDAFIVKAVDAAARIVATQPEAAYRQRPRIFTDEVVEHHVKTYEGQLEKNVLFPRISAFGPYRPVWETKYFHREDWQQFKMAFTDSARSLNCPIRFA